MRFLTLFLILCVLFSPAIAATVTVYPNGTAPLIAVPAGQFINVFTWGSSSARVFKLVGYPNIPSNLVLETNGVVSNQETSFGPYTNATIVRIEAGTDPVLYSVGAGAIPIPVQIPSPALVPSSGSLLRIPTRVAYSLPTPIAKTTAITLLASELLTGMITGTHSAGATQAYTLPTGALLDAALPLMQINDAFEWNLICLSTAASDSITVTANTGHTIVGSAIVISTHVTTGGSITSQGCNSSTWITQRTGVATYVTYRKN